MVDNNGSAFRMELTVANQLRVRTRTAAGLVCYELVTTPTYLAGSGWHHAAVACDLAVPVASIVVDGAVPALGTNIVNNRVIDHTRTSWTIGTFAVGVSPWNGGVSEFYLNLAEYVDITVAANLELLRHPNGQPPNIGANGQLVTTNQPIGYFVEEGGVMVNRGSGGAFVTAGAPALSADSPKDRWVASLNYQRRKRIRAA